MTDPVVAPAAGDDGLARLRYLAGFDRLLAGWSEPAPDRPALSPVEHDTLAVIHRAAQLGRGLTISLPGGRSRLPLLAAVLLAAAELRRPIPRPGAVALVTAAVARRAELAALAVAGVPVGPALHPVRLRADGLVSRPDGGGVSLLGDQPRLLYVHPSAHWASPLGRPPLTVVIDDGDDPDGALTAEAHAWAIRNGTGRVIAFRHLAAAVPAEADGLWWPLDWAALRTNPLPAGLAPDATASTGQVRVVVVRDARTDRLIAARTRLRQIDAEHDGDPAPLALKAAARLARLLLDLAVPLNVYDAHTYNSIARSLASRRDDLEETTAQAFTGSWRLVGELDWALLRRELVGAVDDLGEVNHKALALGALVETALGAGEELDVWLPSRIAAEATQTWLLTSGFAVPAAALAEGRVRLRSLGDPAGWDQQRLSLFTGVPAYRHAHRLVDGDLGRLMVLCYPREARAVGGMVGRTLGRPEPAAATAARAHTIEALFGAPTRLAEPRPILVQVEEATAPELPATVIAAAHHAAGVDAAEAAALDPSGWWHGEDEDPDTPAVPTGPVAAVAVVVEPVTHAGGALAAATVVLADATATLDRVVGRRVIPVAARELAPGMLLVGISGPERRGMFERLRPHLDQLNGPGTTFWLGLWRSALGAALRTTGSPAALAAALHETGITAEAVRHWPTPYRIGPLLARNVALVGNVAGNQAVATEARRIAVVMQAVRARHRRIGRAVAAAASAAAAGAEDAFDSLADTLGPDIAECLGDLSAWRVLAVPGLGRAARSALWRPVTLDEAARLFSPDVPDDDAAASQPQGATP